MSAGQSQGARVEGGEHPAHFVFGHSQAAELRSQGGQVRLSIGQPRAYREPGCRTCSSCACWSASKAGRAPTEAAIGQTTSAIIAEIGAASREVLAAGSGRHHPGVGLFLQVRMNRLAAAADEVIAAARDGDPATLRRVLRRFEELTSAIWTVQDSVRRDAQKLTNGT
jgi:hypothetical protein